MLYISRYLSPRTFEEAVKVDYMFGVVDSDDGVETICSSQDIVRYVRGLGVVIEGAVGYETEGVPGFVMRAHQYGAIPSAVAKTSMILQANVVTYKSRISYIERSEYLDNARLRLSSFGTGCWDYMLKSRERYNEKISLTLVVDDKIKDISDAAFLWCRPYCIKRLEPVRMGATIGLGVNIDLRELTNDELAKKIYLQLGRYEDDVDEFVLDKPDRLSYGKSMQDTMRKHFVS